MFVQLLINTLIVGSGYGLIAMAFRLMYSVSPFFNLTLGTVAAAGAYAVFYLTSSAGLTPWWAVLLALAISGTFAWVLEAYAYRPMRRRGASPMITSGGSLGFTRFSKRSSICFSDLSIQTLGIHRFFFPDRCLVCRNSLCPGPDDCLQRINLHRFEPSIVSYFSRQANPRR